jgi:superfamily II DNA or RNA helicase
MGTVTLSKWDKAPVMFVESPPENAISALEDELSYEVPDAEHTQAYQAGRWDGKQRVIRQTGEDYFFPVGCLERAVRVIRGLGYDVDVRGVERPGRGDRDYEWNTDMELRDYQQEALNDALEKGTGIICLPTGSGKTLIGIRLIYELQHPAIITAHQQEIADQWADRLERILNVDVGRCYGGDRESGDVQVCLYQSLHDSDSGVRDDVRLDHPVLISDECHREGADVFSQVTGAINSPYRFGLSATPERDDNATLRIIGGVGELIANISPESMISDGYLAEPEWHILDPPPSRSTYRKWNDEYKGEVVKNAKRNDMIAQKAAELPSPTYIHVERIAHGERLESMVPESEFVSADHSDRTELMESFKDGDLPVLISTLAGEGFDAPAIRTLIMAGGLKTEVGTIQKIGRALRPETDNAHIVDFRDRGRWVGDHSEQRIRTYRDYYGEYGP